MLLQNPKSLREFPLHSIANPQIDKFIKPYGLEELKINLKVMGNY